MRRLVTELTIGLPVPWDSIGVWGASAGDLRPTQAAELTRRVRQAIRTGVPIAPLFQGVPQSQRVGLLEIEAEMARQQLRDVLTVHDHSLHGSPVPPSPELVTHEQKALAVGRPGDEKQLVKQRAASHEFVIEAPDVLLAHGFRRQVVVQLPLPSIVAFR